MSTDGLLAAPVLAFLVVLLGGVTIGYFYAVEAAAMGAFALLVAGLVTGRLPRVELAKMLGETIALTGALFALLLAATTFARAAGADVERGVQSPPAGDDQAA